MEIKLSRGEYWILCLASAHEFDCGRGLESLAGGEEHIAGLFNLESHGLDLDALVNTLCGMFERKWLDLTVDRTDVIENHFIPSSDYIHDIFYGPPEEQPEGDGHYFWLTPEGFRVWEAFAAPQWDRYIEAVYSSDEGPMEVIAAQEYLLDEYLKLFSRKGARIFYSSLKYDTIEPWQIGRCKQLPKGYRVRFNCIGVYDAWESNLELNNLLDGWVRWK